MNPLEDEESLSRRGFLVGTAGAAVATGASTTAVAQEDDAEGENGDGDENGANGVEDEEETDAEGEEENGNGDDDGGNGGGGGTEHVEIGDNYFEPDDLTVLPGTTVVWEWTGDIGHDVTPRGDPPVEWEGHPELQDSGTHEETFEEEGVYEYLCTPHPEMTASITVDPDADQMGGGPVDLVPDVAWTLIIATTAGMLSTLSLVYFFMRYGGTSPESA